MSNLFRSANMKFPASRFTWFSGIFILSAAFAFATKPTPDIAVTTYLSDFNASNAPYYVQSDGGGAYQNGVAGVGSYLNANGYNRITWGDWRLDLYNSPSRLVAVTFR